MTLGEYIKEFREQHHISQRKFVEMCKGEISTGYVCMLEKNINPKTGKTLTPSIEMYKLIADATGITLDALIARLDGDQQVTVTTAKEVSQSDLMIGEILRIAEALPADKLELARSLLTALSEHP